MSALITFVHVVICIVLIVAVLLQSGKAADLAGAFGGGGSQTAFGPRSTASIMSRVTTICAVLFMVTSLGLWVLSGREGKSAVSGEQPAPTKPPAAQTETKPADKTPATQAVTPPAGTSAAPATTTKKPADKPAEKQPAAKTETKPPSTPVKK